MQKEMEILMAPRQAWGHCLYQAYFSGYMRRHNIFPELSLAVSVFPPQIPQFPHSGFQATFALIIGYSWIDGHYAQVGSPGIGWPVAWRRWVLVVIGENENVVAEFVNLNLVSCSGSAASFIVMMLPPTSGRKAVRLRNASSITAISNAYGFLVSAWIAAKPPSSQEVPDTKWATDFRGRLLALGQEIGTIRGQTSMARWEGSIRGAWPFDEYMALVDVQSDMIAGLAQVRSTPIGISTYLTTPS
jgi:hypothetical protein